ncbi:MAG: SpoIVB peptidase [Christensenellaceae bacterium]|nr:SpoIVB peptidase [Christensenellaceae bacterium]
MEHSGERAAKRRKSFKKVLGIVLAGLLTALNFMPSVQSLRNLPKNIRISTGQSQSFSFALPMELRVEQESVVVSLSGDESLGIQGESSGSANLTFSLMGLPLKQVTVKVENEKVVMPGGAAVGIAMYTDGVFVVDSADVFLPDGTHRNPAKEAGLQSGDTITKLGSEQVRSMQDLLSIVKNSTSNTLKINYKRGGRSYEGRISPAVDESGARRLGLWVRDSTAGIGTLTYFDPSAKRFGALGHAITDVDTLQILPIRDGDVYPSKIVDVKKGEKGSPGELHGVFSDGQQKIGTINKNTDYGVYGSPQGAFVNPLYPQGLPVGTQSSVHPGQATILATIDEGGVREFDCQIIRVTPQLAPAQRSMVIQVTDPELLQKTGGIVQGMSGSPILQDGYLIGAVTHVYVNDPTRGYGLFLDWMLDMQ